MKDEEQRSCKICKIGLNKNRQPRHHIIPKKHGRGIPNNRADICKKCEMVIHKADDLGYVDLPRVVSYDELKKQHKSERKKYADEKKELEAEIMRISILFKQRESQHKNLCKHHNSLVKEKKEILEECKKQGWELIEDVIDNKEAFKTDLLKKIGKLEFHSLALPQDVIKDVINLIKEKGIRKKDGLRVNNTRQHRNLS